MNEGWVMPDEENAKTFHSIYGEKRGYVEPFWVRCVLMRKDMRTWREAESRLMVIDLTDNQTVPHTGQERRMKGERIADGDSKRTSQVGRRDSARTDIRPMQRSAETSTRAAGRWDARRDDKGGEREKGQSQKKQQNDRGESPTAKERRRTTPGQWRQEREDIGRDRVMIVDVMSTRTKKQTPREASNSSELQAGTNESSASQMPSMQRVTSPTPTHEVLTPKHRKQEAETRLEEDMRSMGMEETGESTEHGRSTKKEAQFNQRVEVERGRDDTRVREQSEDESRPSKRIRKEASID